MKKSARNSLAFLFVVFMVCGGLYSQNGKPSIIADGVEPVLVSADFKFTEGPAADTEGNVFFTDQPNDRIHKWSAENGKVSVYMENAGRANGMYFDKKGNLLACADENSQLWQIGPDKKVTVLVDGFKGKRLNGPNDLWVDPKGGIYITDPFYKRDYWTHTEKEIEAERVYYLSPDRKKLSIVADDFVQPNGIVGSADGKTLYIADIGDKKTYSYTMGEDGSLSDKKLFAELGSDGMALDEQGNLYLTGQGVTVFNKQGEKIQHIPIDENWTANVTFGGSQGNILFITAMDSLYSLEMQVRGAHFESN
ncbi:MAG: SMP-30/gluconolactonase/LRE family protein [Sediminicola sp.]